MDLIKKITSGFLILLMVLTNLTGCYTYNVNKVSEFRQGSTSNTIVIPKRALQIRFDDEFSPRSNKYYTLQQNIGFRAIERYVKEYELTNKYPVEFIAVIAGKDSIHYQFHSCDTCKFATVIKTYLTDQMIEIETVTAEISAGKTIVLIVIVGGVSAFLVKRELNNWNMNFNFNFR